MNAAIDTGRDDGGFSSNHDGSDFPSSGGSPRPAVVNAAPPSPATIDQAPAARPSLDGLIDALAATHADFATKFHLTDAVRLGREPTEDEEAIWAAASDALEACEDALLAWRPTSWGELARKIVAARAYGEGIEDKVLAALSIDVDQLQKVEPAAPLESYLSAARQMGDHAETMGYADEGRAWLGAPLFEQREEILMRIHAAPCRTIADAAAKVGAIRLELGDCSVEPTARETAVLASLATVQDALIGARSPLEAQFAEWERARDVTQGTIDAGRADGEPRSDEELDQLVDHAIPIEGKILQTPGAGPRIAAIKLRVLLYNVQEWGPAHLKEPMASALEALTASTPDPVAGVEDPVLTLAAEWLRLGEVIEATPFETPEGENEVARLCEAQAQIAREMLAHPTLSAAGARAKLLPVESMYDHGLHSDGWDLELFDQVVTYLQGASGVSFGR